MNFGAGWIIAPRNEEDTSLWFIIYADEEGLVAFDLTRQHPHIFYRGFEAVLDFEDMKPITEKIVLQGGPERSDDALIILHETAAATPDSTVINDQFAFLSYNYVALPGQPPTLTTADNKPTRIKLKRSSNFLIAVGYRIFDSAILNEEIKSGTWICLPATNDLVFNTNRHDRRAKILRQLN